MPDHVVIAVSIGPIALLLALALAGQLALPRRLLLGTAATLLLIEVAANCSGGVTPWRIAALIAAVSLAITFGVIGLTGWRLVSEHQLATEAMRRTDRDYGARTGRLTIGATLDLTAAAVLATVAVRLAYEAGLGLSLPHGASLLASTVVGLGVGGVAAAASTCCSESIAPVRLALLIGITVVAVTALFEIGSFAILDIDAGSLWRLAIRDELRELRGHWWTLPLTAATSVLVSFSPLILLGYRWCPWPWA